MAGPRAESGDFSNGTLAPAATLQENPPLSLKQIPAYWGIIFAFGVLAVGLLGTLLLFIFANRAIHTRARFTFEQRAANIVGAFDKQVSLYLNVLNGFRGLYAANNNVERGDFAAYASSVQLAEQFRGFLAVEFVKRVPESKLEAFEAQVKSDTSVNSEGYPGFSVHPRLSAPEHLVITYTEPASAATSSVLGFDIVSDNVRWEAAQKARDEGLPAISGPLTLIQDESRPTPAFITFLPLYQNHMPEKTVEERRAALVGYIAGVFRASEFIAQFLTGSTQLQNMDLKIFYGPVLSARGLLYDSNARPGEALLLRGGLQFFGDINVVGHPWTLIFYADSVFGLSRLEKWLPSLLLFAGLMFSMLLFLVVIVLTQSRSRALQLADRMTRDVRASEAHFRSLIAHAQDIITILNPNGIIRFESPSIERILGYKPEEMIGKNAFDFMHPDDKARAFGVLASALLLPGATRSVVFRFRRKDGFWRVLEAVSTNQVLDPVMRGLVINSRDITDREEARRRIEESAERFRGLVANIPGAVYRCACDSNWTMEFVSDAIEAIAGYPAKDFVNNADRTYASIIHPEDRLMVERAVLTAVERKEIYSLEYRIIHADASQRWIHMQGRGSFDEQGRLLYLDGIFFDVTNHKQIEEALKQREAQFRAISESSPLGLFVTDAHGHWTYMNARCQEIAGLSQSEALGEGWTQAVHPDDRPCVFKQWYAFAEASGRFESVHRFRRKDGGVVWIHTLATPMRDGERLLGYVGTIEDITDRKQTEDELQAAYWNLKEAQAQLVQSEKLASIGQLAAGVAHEVKNPLAIILQGIGYLDLLPVIKEGQDAEILDMMRKAIQRADRIIRQLLDFARPAALARTAVSVSKLIESSVELVKAQLRASKINVSLEVQSSLPPLLIDENQMRQVVVNLVLNAFQAMPQGGELKIRAEARPVTAEDLQRSHRLPSEWQEGQRGIVISIIDTGMGIPKHLMSRIWDPFFTTKPSGQGTGLGLSVTQSILEAHHGLLGIESEEGKGTTVVMVLPSGGPNENPHPAH